MKKWIYTALILLLFSSISGCAAKVNNTLPVDAPPAVVLPETVVLDFKPIEMTQLKGEKPEKNWELVKSVPFGAVENEAVLLDLYKDINNSEADNTNLLKAQLKYKGSTYTLLGDVSSSMLEGAENKINPNLIQKSSYLLLNSYGNKDNPTFLLGGIELFANGQGLVAYLVYDKKNNSWQQFEEWGIPYLEDLDSDNNKELIIQFPGLHMQFPDVKIIRWGESGLEQSGDFKAILGINEYQPSTVYFEPDNKMYFSVDVNTDGEAELINLAKSLYKYENDKLVKVQE